MTGVELRHAYAVQATANADTIKALMILTGASICQIAIACRCGQPTISARLSNAAIADRKFTTTKQGIEK